MDKRTTKNIIPQKTKSKIKKRVGRGISSGQGKTAGRGTKGQRSRSGFNIPKRFEGGQTPYLRRMPKLKGRIAQTGRIENTLAILSGLDVNQHIKRLEQIEKQLR